MAKRIFTPEPGYLDDRARTRRGFLVAGWLVSMVVVAFLARNNWSVRDLLPQPAQTDARTPAVAKAPSSKPAPSIAAAKPKPARAKPVEETEGQEVAAADKQKPESVVDDSEKQPDSGASERGPATTDTRLGQLRLAGIGGLVPLPNTGEPGEAVAGWCKALSRHIDSVSLSQCMLDRFKDSGHRSVDGRPLIVGDVAATAQPSAGRVLLLSATHGDEPSSIGTVFRWMHYMAQSGTHYEWHVAPTVNPDGVLHQPATRVNANGVDLNRNLPTTGWAKESRDYWRRVGFEKRRFPGENPGSEPENVWLADEIKKYQPDVIISLHAPYGVLDYDGDFPAPRKLGSLNLHRLGVYPGSLGNFASRMQGIPVITVELNHADELPAADETRQMWRDLNGWLDRYFRSVRQVRSESDGEAG